MFSHSNKWILNGFYLNNHTVDLRYYPDPDPQCKNSLNEKTNKVPDLGRSISGSSSLFKLNFVILKFCKNQRRKSAPGFIINKIINKYVL